MKIAGLAAVLLGSYFMTGLIMVLSLDRFMYFPVKGLGAEPADFGLEGEDVDFAAPDGTNLHGWYFPRPDSRAVLVFLHGNAGNISHRLATVHQLLRAPADIFLFDYRGYGRSGGEARGEGPLLDAGAALAAVRSRAGSSGKKIVLLGESIGGAMALALAGREQVDGVITLSAFTSTRGVARSMPLYWIFSPIVPNRYNALDAVSRIEAPVLIIHGRDDEIIPFSHGERLYGAAGEGRDSFWVENGMHNDLFAVAGIEIVDRITDFIEALP